MLHLFNDVHEKICNYLKCPSEFIDFLDDSVTDEEGFITITSLDGLYHKCISPSVLYMSQNVVGIKILKIDEYSKLLRYYNVTRGCLYDFNNSVPESVADSLHLLPLPRNQKLIDYISKDDSYFVRFITFYKDLQRFCTNVLSTPFIIDKIPLRNIA